MNSSMEALIYRCGDMGLEMALLELHKSAMAELDSAMPDHLPFREPAVENLYNHPDPELQASVRNYLAVKCGRCFFRPAPGRADKALLYSLDFFSCMILYLQSVLEKRHQAQDPARMDYTLELACRGEEFSHVLRSLKFLGSLYPDISIHITRPQPSAPRLPLEQELFPEDPGAQEIFLDICRSAGQELLRAPWLSMKALGQVLSQEQWKVMSDRKRLEAIRQAGSLGVCFLDDHRVNVDFVSLIPCCEMLAIYFKARQLPEDQRTVLIDAGEGQDITFFSGIARMLAMCDHSFQCRIFSA